MENLDKLTGIILTIEILQYQLTKLEENYLTESKQLNKKIEDYNLLLTDNQQKLDKLYEAFFNNSEEILNINLTKTTFELEKNIKNAKENIIKYKKQLQQYRKKYCSQKNKLDKKIKNNQKKLEIKKEKVLTEEIEK